jgi:hypothetical protein
MHETFLPASWSNFAVEDVTTPLPRPDITPPVTKINFGFLLALLVFGFLTADRTSNFGSSPFYSFLDLTSTRRISTFCLNVYPKGHRNTIAMQIS